MTSERKGMEVGYALAPVSRAMTTEKMRAFTEKHDVLRRFGVTKTIHTDEELAKASGMRKPIVPGSAFACYLSQMLFKAFRERWVEGGRLSVSFVRPAFAGDTLTARGIVRERAVEGSTARLMLDVWVENQKGERVVVGKASVFA